jgi:hypothetical protein
VLRQFREAWPLFAIAVLAAGCGPALAPGPAERGESATSFGTRSEAGGTVLTAAQLRGVGSLLEAMNARLANMRVTRQGHCPQITFRGHRSLVAASAPTVYVDGTRAANTCVLDQIRSSDVRSIEVYAGATNRPGYRASPHGMVLVFMRGSAAR